MSKDTYKFTLKKAIYHFATICQHKYFVFVNCCKCGIPFRGFMHDWSKFSFTEFFTNCKYVRPGISPIDVQKMEFGYAPAWMHHKGHNPHHHIYWMDRFDEGCYVTRMPYKYAVEEICDILAANRVYTKKKSYEAVYIWWSKKRKIEAIHPDNRKFFDEIFSSLKDIELGEYKIPNITEKDILNKEHLKFVYNYILEESEYDHQELLSKVLEEAKNL